MAGWHHWLDGRESQWTPGVGDGQGGLACCNSRGCKELDMTERLNWTELNWRTSRTSEVPCDGLWHPGPSSRPGRQGPAITFSIAGSEEGSLEFSFSFFSPPQQLPLWLSNFPSFLFYLSLPLSFLAVNTFFNSDSPKCEQLNIFNKMTLLQNYSTASASPAKMTFSFLLFHTLFRRSRCLIVFFLFLISKQLKKKLLLNLSFERQWMKMGGQT